MKRTSKDGFHPINDQGDLINIGDKRSIPKEYMPLLDDIVLCCRSVLKENLKSIYLRGSLSCGSAIKRISDVDLVVIARTEVRLKDKIKIIELSEKIVKGTIIPFVDMTIVPYALLTDRDYSTLKLNLVCKSCLLYGDDVLVKIQLIKVNRELAEHIYMAGKKDIMSLQKFFSEDSASRKYLYKERSARFWCIWTARTMLRTAFALIVLNKHVYTNDARRCHDELVKQYSIYEKELNLCLEWERKPINDKKQVSILISDFLPKIDELWREEIKSRSFSASAYDLVRIKGTYITGFKTARQVLGPVKGKTIIDFGCGPGRSSAFLRKQGAKVIGVDTSRDAINLAKKNVPGSRFFLVSNIIGQIKADDVFCSFVHTGAKTFSELMRMNKTAIRILKKEGRFIILTANPAMWGLDYKSCKSHLLEGKKSGKRIRVVLKEKPPIIFDDYYWSINDQKKALKRVGFSKIKVVFCRAIKEKSRIPPYIVIEAKR